MKECTLYGMPSSEGLAKHHQLDIVNVTTTLGELVDTFPIHDNERDEDLLQRKLTNTRAKKIRDYLLEREDAIFPQLAAFVTSHATIDNVEGMFRSVSLPEAAERMLVDGQGRREGGKLAMEENPSLAAMTVDIKVIRLNTDTLLGSAPIIRQVFSDYHKNVVKPNSSINLFFDSSKQSSAFYVDVLKHLEAEDSQLAKQVSREGSTDKIYTLAQFKTFIEKLTGMTAKKMDQEFVDDAELRDMWLKVIALFVKTIENESYPGVYSSRLTAKEVKQLKATHLACCAIGIEALGRLGNLIIDNALLAGEKPDFAILAGLSSIDMDRQSSHWEGSVMHNGKIIKGSAQTLSTKLAIFLRIQMSEGFLGIS